MSGQGAAKRFQPIYRFGGPTRCQWRRILATYPTEAQALEACASLIGQGTKVLVAPVERWDRVGLPEGWCPEIPSTLRGGWWVPDHLLG